MLPIYTAHYLASQAQRRHFDGVRLDGRVTDRPSLWRSMVTALFSRSAPTSNRRPTRLGGLVKA